MRLNAEARDTLRTYGVTLAEWARLNDFADGQWYGDACG